MSRPKKRTRVTAKKTAAIELTVREYHEVKNGRGYLSYLVQGWKEDGKWKRRKFKSRSDAERFVALKRVELENQGRSQRMVLSPLTDSQIEEAVEAFDLLGETYSLKQAVEFFLENHRAPDFTISLSEAIELYLEDQTRDGTRERTIVQKRSVLTMYKEFVNDDMVHLATPQKVESFLRSLRAKDKVSPASRKTWNNYRNDLNHFFGWASQNEIGTQRPWIFHNPVEKVKIFTSKQVAEQRPQKATTSAEDVQRLLSVLMRWRNGDMVKFFALAYFAGIRPSGEMKKLSEREKELINLETGIIHIPANVSKTKEERQIFISENLKQWLTEYKDKPIIPKNFDRLAKQVRSHFGLQHDETRHSFISYHVAVHRSIGDVALQAGNSEGIVRKHYLNLHPKEEGETFFSITPSGIDEACKKSLAEHSHYKII